jgi:hypothetical protein
MGFDDQTTDAKRPDARPSGDATQHDVHEDEHNDHHEPLSLTALSPPRRPDIDALLRAPEKIRFPEQFKPRTGHPTVGAGTSYSDVIRDTHKDEIPFHLGPRPFRGDVTTIPSPLDVPTAAVPAVPMKNIGASADFAQHVRDQTDSLPAPIRKLLADQGMTVIATDKMPDAAPDIKDEHPRGWPPGTTMANEDGAFRPDKRAILVAETFVAQDGKETHTDRAEGVLRHETGHAVDAALDNFSQSDAFKAAYDKDVAAMPDDVKKKLEYLLQSDGAGAQECFAEVFASIYGGSANDSQTGLILKSFPNVTDLVRQKLASLKP